MYEALAAIALIIGGGVFMFARNAGGSIPDFEIDEIFKSPSKEQQKTNIDPNDIDILARTIWGEARGQGYAGMQAVASVVMNRFYAAQNSSAKARQYGRTVAQICQKPYQFSVWNENDPNRAKLLAVDENNSEFRRSVIIASRAIHGDLPDNTGGADHYLNISATKAGRGGSLPSWVDLSLKTAVIGSHTFLKLG